MKRYGPLVALLLLAALPRLYHLSAPFVTRDEWGHSQFAIYGRNYVRLGFLGTRLLPTFGVIGSKPIVYTHHPFLGSLIVGVWFLFFGSSEASYRLLTLAVELWAMVSIYRLGLRLANQRAGLLAAFIYGTIPLAIYLCHTYCMELPHQACVLAFAVALIDWRKHGRPRDLGLAALWLALATEVDYYSVYLVGFLWLLALAEKPLRKRLLALSTVPLLALATFLLYLQAVGGLSELGRGASKYARSLLLLDPQYYRIFATSVLDQIGIVPILLGVIGLVVLWRRGGLRWELTLVVWLAFWDFVITSRATYVHPYRVLFWSAPLAIYAGVWLAELPLAAMALLVTACVVSSAWLTPPLFQDIYGPDVVMCKKSFGPLTRPTDVILGQPPYMAYYVDHLATMPYDYLWAGPGYYHSREDFLARLGELVRAGDFQRVQVFSKFILNPEALPAGQEVDWSHSLDALSEWRLGNKPGLDPQVWVRR